MPKCIDHPMYTGKNYSKCARECETCRLTYLEVNPEFTGIASEIKVMKLETKVPQVISNKALKNVRSVFMSIDGEESIVPLSDFIGHIPKNFNTIKIGF